MTELNQLMGELVKKYGADRVKSALESTINVNIPAMQQAIDDCFAGLANGRVELTSEQATIVLACVLWSRYFPCVNELWRPCNEAVKAKAKEFGFDTLRIFPL